MKESLKRFVKYLYVYKVYGLYLFAQIYWFKKTRVRLKGYGIFHIRPHTYDAEVFDQIFIHRQYNFQVSGPVRTIVDLGGNNGMSALYFHRRYPDAIIYVLEPDKNNFSVLEKNIAGIRNIVPLNKAIWKENGTVNINSAESWAIKIDMDNGTNPTEAISMTSLINTFQIDQIDLLKIDIEGAEKELFESSPSFLDKTRNLIIELHDWIRPGCAQPFFRSLSNYSYHYGINHENTLIIDLKPQQ